MRSIILTLSALALSSSVVFAQTPPAPPPAGGAPTAEQPMAPPPPPPAPPGSADPGAAAPPPPPPNGEAVDDDMVDGPEGGPAMHGKPGGPDHKMMGHGGPRHHMRPGGPRGDRQWRGMRRAQGPEFKIEIDDEGGVKVEVKCGPREEARACADITMELMDRAMSN